VSQTLLSIALVAGVSWLGLAALAWLLQGKMVYFPMSQIVATPADHGMDFEEVMIETTDGVRLQAWFVRAAEPAGRTVLFFHGNAGNLSHRMDSLVNFRGLGLDTLLVSYRGYGNSDGRPSETGTYLDAAAAWDHLTNERGIPGERIVVFGRSLGGAVASWVAAERDPGGLILESSFTSIIDLGARYYWFLPVRLLSRFSYDTLGRLPQVRAPVLIVHSPQDEIVPFEHAEALYEAAPEPRTLLRIRGGHNDGFLLSGAAYIDGLRSFVATLDDPTDAAAE